MAVSRAGPVEAARDMLGVSTHELWIDYIGLGGSLMPAEIQAFLSGRHRIGDYDHDVLAQALNERFLARGDDHPLRYADELDDDLA